MGYMRDAEGTRLDSFPVASAREARRRRPYPLPIAAPAALGAQPTKSLTKATGANAVTVTAGGSGYVVGDKITLAGGTPVYATTLIVTAVSSGAVTGAAVLRPGVYANGSQPTGTITQASTTGGGTGATFTVTYAASLAASMESPATTGPTSPVFRFLGTGPANISSSGYYGNAAQNGVPCIWEFTTDAAQLDIKLLGLATKLTVFVNGQRLDDTDQQTDASGAPWLYSIGWATAVPRTYRIFAVNCAFGGVITQNTASVWKPTEQRRPLAWALGDSYTFGTNAAAAARAGINVMADLLGIDVLPDGLGGSGWNTASPNDPVSRINGRLAVLTEKPSIVFLDLGLNDAGGDMAALATRFNAAVAAIRATVPTARIIVFGPATPVGETGNLATVKTTIAGLCATAGLSFIDVANWVNANNKTAYTGGDNTHPTQAGYEYLAARRAQVVSPLLV